jgi:hypothetical protein
MNPAQLDALLAVASLTVFAAGYAVALVTTRSVDVRPCPATPELGEEPPAVVSLLVNRWKLTPDAAEATLLDLAARGYLELRQTGDGAAHTTIHLRSASHDAGLARYERRVLRRVEDLAINGVVPVTGLAFRRPSDSRGWALDLAREVRADARRRGLSRRRFSDRTIAALVAVAAVSAAGVATVSFRLLFRAGLDSPGVAVLVFFMTWLGLTLAAVGEDRTFTETGRAALARWWGVREWLRAHPEFGELPPAAVTVWGRYLAYGAALGVTHTTSEVLDLGLGDRRLVWSSYGGTWRRVRVRYPRPWLHYGHTLGELVARGVAAALLGAFGAMVVATNLPDRSEWWRGPMAVPALLGAVGLTYGGYVLVRAWIDLWTTRTVTGEVLWIRPARRSLLPNGGLGPLRHLAVDDGSRDRTTAWALPGRLRAQVAERDLVTLQVRPWTRRVVTLTVVAHSRTRTLRDAPGRLPLLARQRGVRRGAGA